MSYSRKAKEFRQVAQFCRLTGQYNSAVGRYYYAAFLMVKDIASIESTAKVRHGRILAKYFKYLHNHNITLSDEVRLSLRKNWSILYERRRDADYYTTEMNWSDAKKSMKAFKIVQEVLQCTYTNHALK